MTAQEAILEIVRIFDEGNREIEQVLELHGMHSLKAGEMVEKIERSIMFRVGQVVREWERSDARRPAESPDLR
ncbi:MAG: hypothetical protein ACUVSM_02350 [Armatimonadota bacterium]|nr:MAG: hypothetical protein KatS3mg024_1180 [Armatimonadota bacterium]